MAPSSEWPLSTWTSSACQPSACSPAVSRSRAAALNGFVMPPTAMATSPERCVSMMRGMTLGR